MAHHGVMADDELDELYGVKPEEFTALRTELAAAAKKRGDSRRGEADLRRPQADHRGMGGQPARAQQ